MTFLSKEARQLEGARYFGVDLAKRETQLAVLDADGVQISQKRFATERGQFLALAGELREGDTVADPTAPLIPGTDLVFDPTRPTETDWERILSQHTERLLLRYQKRAASRSNSAPRPDLA